MGNQSVHSDGRGSAQTRGHPLHSFRTFALLDEFSLLEFKLTILPMSSMCIEASFLNGEYDQHVRAAGSEQ